MPDQKPQDPVDAPFAEWFAPLDGCKWRVEAFERLTAEIQELKREDLPEFHVWIRKEVGQRAWLIFRRLFGFTPREVPLSGNPDDYRPHTRKEVCEKLSLTEKELDAEIEAVRLGWRRNKRIETEQKASVQPIVPMDSEHKSVVFTEEQDEEFCARFGVSPRIFEMPNRDRSENTLEKAWFAKRLREWEPLLTKSTMTEQLARSTLFNEMRLRRDNDALWKLDLEPANGSAAKAAREKRRKIIADRIKELQDAHAKQLEAIQEHAPWFNTSEAQISATGAIAQLIQGIQEWESRADTKIIDGVFTSTELQVLIRTSKQIEEPRYRWGWVLYVNESRKWLWDPKAKSWMKESDLARFDNGFKEAVKRFNETSNDRVVDLEKDGPDGAYDDLIVPKER